MRRTPSQAGAVVPLKPAPWNAIPKYETRTATLRGTSDPAPASVGFWGWLSGASTSTDPQEPEGWKDPLKTTYDSDTKTGGADSTMTTPEEISSGNPVTDKPSPAGGGVVGYIGGLIGGGASAASTLDTT